MSEEEMSLKDVQEAFHKALQENPEVVFYAITSDKKKLIIPKEEIERILAADGSEDIFVNIKGIQ